MPVIAFAPAVKSPCVCFPQARDPVGTWLAAVNRVGPKEAAEGPWPCWYQRLYRHLSGAGWLSGKVGVGGG